MNVDDFVLVVGTASLPNSLLGRYGKITEVNPYKVTVEFSAKSKGRGTLSSTAFREDLLKVGISCV